MIDVIINVLVAFLLSGVLVFSTVVMVALAIEWWADR